MPHVEDLRAYTGYFYAIDPVFHDKNFLTKVSTTTPDRGERSYNFIFGAALVCRCLHSPD